MHHRGERLAQKSSAFVGADEHRNHRQFFRLLLARCKAVKGSVAAKFIAPTRKARLEMRRAFVTRPKVAIVAHKSEHRFRNTPPAPRKTLGQHHLGERHRQALRNLPTPSVAGTQAEIDVDAFQRLQRFDLMRLAIGMMHDSGSRHVAQTIASATQPPRQVNIFAVHEYSRLEAADFAHCRRTQQHGSTTHPLRIEAYRVVRFRMLKWNLPHLPRGDRDVVRSCIFPKLGQRVILRNCVLIESQNVCRLRILKHAIDARAEAKIAFAATYGKRQSALLHVAVKLAHLTGRRHIAIVVPNPHGQRHALAARAQYGFQQGFQLCGVWMEHHH